MSIHDQVLDFLCEPDNLHIALRIVDSLPKLKEYMTTATDEKDPLYDLLSTPDHLLLCLTVQNYINDLQQTTIEKFWDLFDQSIKDQLAKSDLSQAWEYTPLKNRQNNNWGYCSITPKDVLPDLPLFSYILQQSPEPYHELILAIKTPEDRTVIKKVKGEVSHLGYTNAGGSEHFLYKLTRRKIWSPAFISDMHIRPEELVKEISLEYWDFFQMMNSKMENLFLT